MGKPHKGEVSTSFSHFVTDMLESHSTLCLALAATGGDLILL